MLSSFEHAMRSYDIQYQFVSVNANGMPFQNDLNFKERIVVNNNTKYTENQILLNY